MGFPRLSRKLFRKLRGAGEGKNVDESCGLVVENIVEDRNPTCVIPAKRRKFCVLNNVLHLRSVIRCITCITNHRQLLQNISTKEFEAKRPQKISRRGPTIVSGPHLDSVRLAVRSSTTAFALRLLWIYLFGCTAAHHTRHL